MRTHYQLNYASARPQMYDVLSRSQKAIRILKTLEYLLEPRTLKNFTVLDVGSSTGIIDNILAKKFKKVIGIDIDRDAVVFAKKNFRRRNLEFQVGNAMKLSFPKNSFDVVICTHVYEHVPNQKRLFAEIYRVLKTQGICYLAAQNKLWPWEPHYDLPLLSWLPKNLANFYIRTRRGQKFYYEKPRTYWSLVKLTKKFKRIEFTQDILRKPEQYGYGTVLEAQTLAAWLAWLLSPLAKYFAPTFFWLLKKDQ